MDDDDNRLVMSFLFSSCSFLCLTFSSRTKYLRSSVNKKLGPDRVGGGNDDDKGERGKKERNSVLRDDRKKDEGLLTPLVGWWRPR